MKNSGNIDFDTGLLSLSVLSGVGFVSVFCRVLAAVDDADPLQLFLCLSPQTGQAADPAAAETEGD